VDRPWARLRRVLFDGIAQRRLRNYRWAGLAHQAIFLGFVVLLPRTVVLFGRAFDADFAASVSRNSTAPGIVLRWSYDWLRTVMVLLVLIATGALAAMRVSRHTERLKPTPAAMWLLTLIAAMMVADILYDASGLLLARDLATPCHAAAPAAICTKARSFLAPFFDDLPRSNGAWVVASPVTRLAVWTLQALSVETLWMLGVGSFCLHLGLVLILLVALPHTKHFHLVAVWPNLFFDSLAPTGKLEPVAKSPDALLALVEASMVRPEVANQEASGVGIGALSDIGAKARLDWFACTACGRCTDNCPASQTGKILDPKQLTGRLRAHLQRTPYRRSRAAEHLRAPIVPSVIEAEAVWACTNCGACEEPCPVAVRTVRSIVDLRRHLLLMRGEAPIELQRAFEGIERQHNPWNLPRDDRAAWAQGLGVTLLRDVDAVEYLYWVGCAASYDERAKSVASALVQLMHRANVSFAILGPEEGCTGDAARRAGNELLFLQLAQKNIQLLNRYQAEGRFERIITACPHCLTTLGNEYPDLGGRYPVVHHSVAIERWIAEGRLQLEQRGPSALVTYHDPCTLARYAGITDEPRRLLEALAGVTLTEPSHHGRHTACCGAGGAQMWLTEQNDERINVSRTRELSLTQADRIVSACPFCLSMLEDGKKTLQDPRVPNVSDIAELVLQRVVGAEDR
jgi:Fe-S oxidoreductase